ncbi:MAG: hypothetical protein CSA76_03750 [Spirochaetales bacterium]|nr:MAG: hypothetical protein CSA76_03750 [Spirochaetales bacterium]
MPDNCRPAAGPAAGADAGPAAGYPRKAARAGLLLNLFILPAGLFAQNVSEEQWLHFMEAGNYSTRIPEEEEMGPLADLNRPEPQWRGALNFCDSVFTALSEGALEEDMFLADVRVPLLTDMRGALGNGALNGEWLYALPLRQGKRLDVPVRLKNDSNVEYGHIYLKLEENRWQIEQWALNISGFIVEKAEEPL